MGGKKTAKKAPPKKAVPKLDTKFTCPFCNHENSCTVKMYVERLTTESSTNGDIVN